MGYEGAGLPAADVLAEQAIAVSERPSVGRRNAIMGQAHIAAIRGDARAAMGLLEQRRRVVDAAGSDEADSGYAPAVAGDTAGGCWVDLAVAGGALVCTRASERGDAVMDIQDSDEVIKWAGGRPPVHPALLARAQMRAALASHDIGTVFRVLNASGWTQRQIAEAVRMQQSQVHEIIRGRRVRDYQVLVRIAEGLKIPRELMHLGAAQPPSAYPGDWLAAMARAEVDEEMLRRGIFTTAQAAAAAVVAGKPVARTSAPVPAPAPGPPPSRLLELHVVQVRHLTQLLEEDGRTYGANPQVSSAAAAWASGLLELPGGSEETRRELMVAVAEIHLHAASSASDAGRYEHTLYHCNQTLELATEAGDACFQTRALAWAGGASVRHGHPDDGLGMLQFGYFLAGGIPSGEQRPGLWLGSQEDLRADLRAGSAQALARMGDPVGAAAELAQARELGELTPGAVGTLDFVAASLALEGQRLEEAESFAAASVRRRAGGSRRGWTRAGILLATIHVRVGESDGVELAHRAITGATRICSWRTRQYLIPLADALDARPSTDHRELSRLARQVATTRA